MYSLEMKPCLNCKIKNSSTRALKLWLNILYERSIHLYIFTNKPALGSLYTFSWYFKVKTRSFSYTAPRHLRSQSVLLDCQVLQCFLWHFLYFCAKTSDRSAQSEASWLCEWTAWRGAGRSSGICPWTLRRQCSMMTSLPRRGGRRPDRVPREYLWK